MPLFSYLDHLTQVRIRYGNAAAKFELEHTIALREAEIQVRQQQIEAANT